ncbi:MAG TPA: phosphosulfolactate synthase, partial [Chloroflexota bacterium]
MRAGRTGLSRGHEDDAWGETVAVSVEPRTQKPRQRGVTAVIDKGLGLRALDDLIETAGHAIDLVKLGFGTSAALDGALLRRKLQRLAEAEMLVSPGGTLFEAAWATGHLPDFVARARELGFTALEISDGTVDLPPQDRREAVERAREAGLVVLTEVGKKDPREQLPPHAIAERVLADLALGVAFVTVEGRESGRGVGIFDAEGDIVHRVLDDLVHALPDCTRILWEAPLPKQQAALILRFGPNVNLANVQPGEVLALEALRRG